MVPWSNLKISEPSPSTCPGGCPPSINFPDNKYHHYDDSLTFDWNSVSVTYWVLIEDFEDEIVYEANITNDNSTISSRLKVGNYTSSIYYTGIIGSNISLLIQSDNHQVDASSKITLSWEKVDVTYTIQIREYKETDVPIIHEASNLSETFYDSFLTSF